jgi:hypothetical protein
VIDYDGFTPSAEGLDDGEEAVAGLLSVTSGLSSDLGDANDIATGLASVAGSQLKRD